MAFLDFEGLSYLMTKLEEKFALKESLNGNVIPTNVLTTSDIDDMFSGKYSPSGLKLVDDAAIAHLVERIKHLETHAILDSDYREEGVES